MKKILGGLIVCVLLIGWVPTTQVYSDIKELYNKCISFTQDVEEASNQMFNLAKKAPEQLNLLIELTDKTQQELNNQLNLGGN